MADHGERRRRHRLVLIVSPLQGHMTPMLQLGTYLHSKGFSITIAHSEFNPPDPSNHPDFDFLTMADRSTSGNSPDIRRFMQSLNVICRPHLQEHLVQIMNSQNDKESNQSVVIVHDNLMYFAGSVAREMKLPSIILRSSSAAFAPAVMVIPQLHQQGRFPTPDSLLQEIIPELDPIRYKDLPFIGLPVHETLDQINMIFSKPPPSAFLWNTLEFLEKSPLTRLRQHYKVPIFTIGPLHKIIPTSSTSFLQEDTTCISWLDKQAPKSVVYVSLGSLAKVDEKLAAEMAWGLANSNQPFLWVVRPGSVHGFKWVEFLEKDLANGLKERGLIVKWAPQKEVLAHDAVGGFWSHCGWNSTLESLSEGVPMLCQPLATDQMVNARYLRDVWKIGVEIVSERGEIKAAIRRVLESEEGKEMRKRAKEIQEKVKFAVGESGSSQNSLNDLVDFILSL